MSNVRFDFTGGGSMTRTRIGGLAAAILGLVLLVAAYAKAIDPGLFALQLQDLAPLPLGLAHVLAVLLVGFEAGLGAALVVGWRTPTILLVTNATFLLFLGVVLWHLWSPGDAGASCGCFGNLIERTPQQAVAEDLLFLGVSGLAWLGRRHEPDPQVRRRRLAAAAAGCAGLSLGISAPQLPLDDLATALAPSVTVEAAKLDEVLPELHAGRHLLVLLDRADPNAAALVGHLNQQLRLPGGPTPVWGLAPDDPTAAAAFLWSAGPAFEVRSLPRRVLRSLYRTLPRTALIDRGRIVRTWSGLPPDPALDALARGDLP